MNARLLPLLGLLLATACQESPAEAPPPAAPPPLAAKRYFAKPADGKLHVYFLDVGPGDAALIVSPEGRTVLIDAGPASSANHLANRLPELLATRLDLAVITHPAPDHYGALDAVQKVADMRRLLEPQLPGTAPAYDALLTALGARGVEIFSPAPNPSHPEEPLRLPLGGGAELTVLWPRAPTEPLLSVKDAEHAANSIVLRLTYGETSVLFMGDARAETEALLLTRKEPLHALLLKVGAHGAAFATSPEFLQAVHPRAAILSVDSADLPGLPAADTLARLKALQTSVFRTDKDGEVHAVSDGKRFVLTPQRLSPEEGAPSEHVFEPEEEEVPLAVPLVAPKPETTHPVPAKAVVPKGRGSEDLPGFGQVVDIDQLPKTERPSRAAPKPTKATAGERYVASRKSDVFHVPECRNAKRISPENLITFSSREAASKERRPARDCNP
ncbi:ComEC/Rec2 family competence protein [Stigmatella aurantiaca]|uniref:Metallo-beta-lactamase family protein n=1 Tax=Stigmatella aurantiaca (strain DW4/3-1) TaxID=378806 RepID=Q098Q1_STIAD|nr:MBL fold metallo-hydrolase [Stigmatella aurantiaca]ADO74139.1 Metallo-beta-lactamase family protein [Stigmatella aurantiaca DW4/3-1]EAU68241.1 S-layer protein [Stigmatella aurantiaca DW4/3-1]